MTDISDSKDAVLVVFRILAGFLAAGLTVFMMIFFGLKLLL